MVWCERARTRARVCIWKVFRSYIVISRQIFSFIFANILKNYCKKFINISIYFYLFIYLFFLSLQLI